jgi:hypothetical protein
MLIWFGGGVYVDTDDNDIADDSFDVVIDVFVKKFLWLKM